MKRWVHPDDDPFPAGVWLRDSEGRSLSSNPIDCIRECVLDTFRLRMNSGDMTRHRGKAETATYILVYLCRRRALAWNLLRIFVPLLRPGALDEQTQGQLEFMFIEHAWPAVFDFDDLAEPRAAEFVSAPSEPFDWPDSLNSLGDGERATMLEYAGLAPLADPARPAIAPWNERWFNLEWLWTESAERPPAHALRTLMESMGRRGRE